MHCATSSRILTIAGRLGQAGLRPLHLAATLSKGADSFKVVVVGGGSGGVTTANKLVKILGPGQVGVIEPSEDHYYQPFFTLIGGGVKKLKDSRRATADLLADGCTWIPESAAEFDPGSNRVVTDKGREVKYDFLVVATGIVVNFDQVKGLPEALEAGVVCSNYSPRYVERTYPSINALREGTAIFTQPLTPIKCGGAPQKIMYLAESRWRTNKVRQNIDVKFITGQGAMFSVKKYSDALSDIAQSRGIQTTFRTELIEVKVDSREAVFRLVDSDTVPKATVTHKFDFLHAVPRMSTPPALRTSDLVDEVGYLDVNKVTLQHCRHDNVFGIGDCLNIPSNKTAAAVASQSGTLLRNLKSALAGEPLTAVYDGYTACPLTTDYGKLILAEFDYNCVPLETFPFDQSKESRVMWYLKKDIMAPIYWNGLLKGLWEGPGKIRKILNPTGR